MDDKVKAMLSDHLAYFKQVKKFIKSGENPDELPDIIKELPEDTRPLIMKMFSCSSHFVEPENLDDFAGQDQSITKIWPLGIKEEDGSKDFGYLIALADGKYRPSANELLEDKWLKHHLKVLIEDLIVGKEDPMDPNELILYNTERNEEKNSQLAIQALKNLLEKKDIARGQVSDIKLATYSFVVQMLVDQTNKNIYKKIFAIFDGTHANGNIDAGDIVESFQIFNEALQEITEKFQLPYLQKVKPFEVSEEQAQ